HIKGPTRELEMGSFHTMRGTALLDNGQNQGIVWLETNTSANFDYVEFTSKNPDPRNAVPTDKSIADVTRVVRAPGRITVTVKATGSGATVIDGYGDDGKVSGGLVVVAGKF